jgi:hypothetical protein
VEILGTIVQIFDLKFFKLSQDTGKRIKDDEAGAYTHSCVLNIFVDDGTDNIRTVLWKNQVLNLLGMSESQLLVYREKPELFDQVKTDLLGMIVRIIGRVTRNALFNRLELTANIVLRDVNPEEEMQRLEREAPAPRPASQQVLQPEKKPEPKRKEDSLPADIEDELLSLEDIEDLDEEL